MHSLRLPTVPLLGLLTLDSLGLLLLESLLREPLLREPLTLDRLVPHLAARLLPLVTVLHPTPSLHSARALPLVLLHQALEMALSLAHPLVSLQRWQPRALHSQCLDR